MQQVHKQQRRHQEYSTGHDSMPWDEVWRLNLSPESKDESSDNFRLLQMTQPLHDTTNKMSMRSVKTQISLGIHPVWPESSLCARWVIKDPIIHVDSRNSN